MKKAISIIAMVLLVSCAFSQNRFVPGEPIVDIEKSIDSVYYKAVVYVVFSDSRGAFPDFQKDTTVVSSNYQTGFQVDADRAKAVRELTTRVNANR